jgi:hypothetical protein
VQGNAGDPGVSTTTLLSACTFVVQQLPKRPQGCLACFHLPLQMQRLSSQPLQHHCHDIVALTLNFLLCNCKVLPAEKPRKTTWFLMHFINVAIHALLAAAVQTLQTYRCSNNQSGTAEDAKCDAMCDAKCDATCDAKCDAKCDAFMRLRGMAYMA